MKMDAELNSDNLCRSTEIDGPHGSEAATPEAAGGAASEQASVNIGPREDSQAEATARLVESSVEAEKEPSAGHIGGDKVGDSVATAPSDLAAVNPLGEALAALDNKDYATAKRLFTAIGRTDAAEAIDNALAALDRKDYAKAQGLFEALAPPKPASSIGPPASAGSASSGGPPVSEGGSATPEPRAETQPPAMSTLNVVPSADVRDRRPARQQEKAKKLSARRLLRGTALALVAALVALAIYVPRPNWTFAAAKSQAAADLASAVDFIKASLAAMTGSSAREQQLSAMREISASLTQTNLRLDRIEQDDGARLDRLGERIDADSASKLAKITARLDELDKKAALPATRPSELAGVVARLDRLEKKDAAPASEIASLAARLDKLEKKAAVTAASPVKAFPPPAARASTSAARAESSGANEIAKLDNPKPLLRDFTVEDVQGGVAMIGGRFGEQEVTPGDFIPGAGRVLRIERRGGGWFVLTNRGVIASGASPYE